MGVLAVHGELPVEQVGVAAGAGIAGGGCGEQEPVEVDARLGRVFCLDVVQGFDEDHRPGEHGQQGGGGLERRAAGCGAGPVEADRRAVAVEDVRLVREMALSTGGRVSPWRLPTAR
jgi:hypothetical protein